MQFVKLSLLLLFQKDWVLFPFIGKEDVARKQAENFGSSVIFDDGDANNPPTKPPPSADEAKAKDKLIEAETSQEGRVCFIVVIRNVIIDRDSLQSGRVTWDIDS